MSEAGSVLARVLGWFRETWKQAPPTLRRRWPWFIAGGALFGFLMVLAVRWVSPSGDEDAPVATNQGGSAGADGEGQGDEGLSEEAQGRSPVQPPLKPSASAVDAGAPLSPNVKLTFRTYPARRASVMWGSKRLGFTDRGKPLVVERVRDSGPLDVVVRAPGYLTVHARAYSFNDAFVDVKLTPLDKKDTLYGYQQPLADAGVPEVAPL